MLTLSIELPNASDNFHVTGRITKNQKTVQVFTEDTTGQSVAKAIPLKPGAYHLAIATKNMASGVIKTSELDFTFE